MKRKLRDNRMMSRSKTKRRETRLLSVWIAIKYKYRIRYIFGTKA